MWSSTWSGSFQYLPVLLEIKQAAKFFQIASVSKILWTNDLVFNLAWTIPGLPVLFQEPIGLKPVCHCLCWPLVFEPVTCQYLMIWICQTAQTDCRVTGNLGHKQELVAWATRVRRPERSAAGCETAQQTLELFLQYEFWIFARNWATLLQYLKELAKRIQNQF